ncbi:hypothetical protein [Komagataeibacter rhaeticus]|uniref:hypothetical protein n=1 Tax=Komagataeibacter rhaeticus TaxID=215221 RepID=UPI000A04F207|nr:hypothetical protein [Komagataeibacter rhaeticus]
MTNKHRMGRSALKQMLDTSRPAEIIDNRATALTSHIVVESDIVDVIRDIFDGTSVITDDGKMSKLLSVRAEINESWGQARDAFLSIGRALLDLENVLSKSEYLKLRSGSDRLFPFSDATATQLRQIARAVETGKIPLEKCPGSYGTAYQITLLNDWQLKVAEERGLIRPDVTRREIAALRKELPAPEPTSQRLDKVSLTVEKRRLTRREGNLLQELSAVRQRISELDNIIDSIPDGKVDTQSG